MQAAVLGCRVNRTFWSICYTFSLSNLLSQYALITEWISSLTSVTKCHFSACRQQRRPCWAVPDRWTGIGQHSEAAAAPTGSHTQNNSQQVDKQFLSNKKLFIQFNLQGTLSNYLYLTLEFMCPWPRQAVNAQNCPQRAQLFQCCWWRGWWIWFGLKKQWRHGL